ncbi:hypothetical protein DY000_02002921 [Brassica cretica]|uniref:Uncharacterized protein n=1 Tax=Brassica cretica TaxID=69181 RepID=A0ABQ7C8V7_BRACR|nr:hypothetical protein DY000_02002921 [Brassica cretica]
MTSRPVPGVIGCPPGVPGKYDAELGVIGCPGVDERSARLGNGQYVASFDMSSFWDRL